MGQVRWKEGNVGGDGINPNRQRGFNWQLGQRIETPNLNYMKSKQFAIVSKFMNFSNRNKYCYRRIMLRLTPNSFPHLSKYKKGAEDLSSRWDFLLYNFFFHSSDLKFCA